MRNSDALRFGNPYRENPFPPEGYDSAGGEGPTGAAPCGVAGPGCGHCLWRNGCLLAMEDDIDCNGD